VDTPADTRKTSNKVGEPFTFVSDVDGGLMDAFDLRHVGGGPGGDIARSASVLVDNNGQVLWMRVAENYRVRPAPEEVISAVKAALEPKP
jgi:peroxiredoxin